MNQRDLSNPLIFGQTNSDIKVSHAITVQQGAEKATPTKIQDELDDFSTPSPTDLLKKMTSDVGASSHPHVKKEKINVVSK